MVRTISICADVAQYQVVNKWLYAQWSCQVEVWCPVMGRLTGGNRGGPKCAKFACWTASIHDAYLGIHEHNISQVQPRMPSISRATSWSGSDSVYPGSDDEFLCWFALFFGRSTYLLPCRDLIKAQRPPIKSHALHVNLIFFCLPPRYCFTPRLAQYTCAQVLEEYLSKHHIDAR